MPKRNIVCTEREDPDFIKRIKCQARLEYDYTTVETKLVSAPDVLPDDRSDAEEEDPQVVVLKAGDLTKEEADKQKAKIAEEEDNKPADLEKKIIFKPKNSENKSAKKPTKIQPVVRILFSDDEDDDDDEI